MALKTYSILLAWQDNDLSQGEFGAVVKAENEKAAEKKARSEMRATYAKNYGEAMARDRDKEEGKSWGGRVIDISQGAVWIAQELEDALRDLLRIVDERANSTGWADHGEREKARKLIQSIES
jgi:hypothetical protein